LNEQIIEDINEYYLDSMDISCIHCNAKHFAAKKISIKKYNKRNLFHDFYHHSTIY